jgi:8-oxo-dGTP pyrophosphatase MutT (NUDIX family)
MNSAAVYRIPPGVREVRVHILPYREPPQRDDVDRAWEAMKRENPRLFGGGLYNVLEIDADRGRITAEYDLYKRLVVQPRVETGVNQLSVSALATAPDESGDPCVLIGKRGQQTRIYGGRWQICPAGGVEPPEDIAALGDIGHEKIRRDLAREFEEEVGIDLDDRPALPIAIVHDRIARSYDLVLRVEFDRPCTPRPHSGNRWEHMEIRWQSLRDLAAFDRSERIIEPTRALFRALGWLSEDGDEPGR